MTSRRAFIRAAVTGLLFGSAIARAQRPPAPVIGFLSGSSFKQYANLVDAFRQGLKEAGYVEGQNVVIEYRWVEGGSERLPPRQLAADLVQRKVAVIAASGGSEARLAAKRATATIPIVFTTGGDPMGEGLVSSLGRPGGNVTGVTFLNSTMEGKRLDLLHEVIPDAVSIAALLDSSLRSSTAQAKDVQEAARAIGRQVQLVRCGNEREIENAFAAVAQSRAQALLVTGSGLFLRERQRVVDLAARYAIPAIYESREYCEAGGLVSYGASQAEAYRQTGVYVGRILDGAKPSDLPVLQSARYELVINLRTARSLGLKIPQSVLVRADDAIQ
ncbi:MAG TPA: ABC transporter substrate-binding protein [Casimicrobiaceae bacterium]|nr:ABC transporter substrate-binding protein [Casimicrobiaceae bacterium]